MKELYSCKLSYVMWRWWWWWMHFILAHSKVQFICTKIPKLKRQKIVAAKKDLFDILPAYWKLILKFFCFVLFLKITNTHTHTYTLLHSFLLFIAARFSINHFNFSIYSDTVQKVFFSFFLSFPIYLYKSFNLCVFFLLFLI